jgi:protein-S-isoprenylcysteine O-methyltransferase Ste14
VNALPSQAAAPSPLIVLGRFLFKYRNLLFPVVVLALAFTAPWKTSPANKDALLYSGLAGGFLILLGQILRMAVIGYVYIIRGGKNKQIYAEALVTTGFFAHSRNPLYLGNLISATGLLVLLGSLPQFLIGMGFFLLAYISIVRAEELYLTEKFGEEYRQYMQRVPRFWLRLSGLRASLQGMQFDWRKVLRKEYSTTFGLAIAALLIMTWRINDSYRPIGHDDIRLIAGVLIAIGAGFFSIRILKKKGLLRLKV